jgi:hypothetical protein
VTVPGTSFLRRTVTPYVGQSGIIAGVTMLLAYVALKKTQWDLLWIAALIWVLFTSYVFFFGMKYQISWDQKGLTMSASGGPQRSIQFDEITEIRYETANRDEFLSQARPFRRVVIVGLPRSPNSRIDISLRHFLAQDIDRLIMVIREKRPDLTVPGGRLPSARK